MSKTSNQLEDVFQEVSEYFATVPGITVTPGQSSPPEQYTVTYKLNGACKENDGDVYMCDTHIISISLPFGFPHFPPNCLPESPTFHPDFDSSAICIGDAWEEKKSIVQLILHIGRMIAGELYSTTNAFNEEAAEWYTQNSEQLPFDNPNFAQEISDSPVPDEEEYDEFDSIDTLDDEDFVESFTLEQEEVLETGVDPDRLQLMAKQKRFHALSRELKLTTELFDERIPLETETQNALNAAADLFREAEKLEHQGKQKEALAKYHSIDNLVSDYPKLQDAKDRVQQAFDLLGDWVNGSHDTSSLNGTSTSSNIGEIDTPGSTAGESHRKFFDDKNAVGKKTLSFYLICFGCLALIGSLVFFYLSLNSKLNAAEQNYSECHDLLNKNEFQAAELKCNKALTLTSEIAVIKQKEKKELNAKINALLQTQKFRQGLAGNILVNGKYVPISAKKFIFAFMTAKQDADLFYKQKRWHQAAISYTKALKAAKQTSYIDEALLIETGRLTRLAQLNETTQSGEEALAEHDWKKANEDLSAALQLARGNPNVLPEDIAQLERLFNQAEFNILRETGHQNFDDGQWKSALSNYQQALKLSKKLGGVVEPDAITGLQENIARTKIYIAIEKGKNAFTASRWDEVISQYEKAIVLLRKNSKLLSSINTKESGEKLSRIMLHVEIIQDKQDLAKLLKADAYAPAVEKLREIRKTVADSPFANRPEFQLITEEVSTQLTDIKDKLLIDQLSAYLIDDFEQLFLKHYPASSGSKLSAPKVEYLKKINNSLLFRMQCTEKSGGRPLRLQMDYLYSPADKSWSFYSEE